MQYVVAAFIVLLTLVPITWSWLYYRAQKRKCQKYPFFALRDEVILAIALSDDSDQFVKTYEHVNKTIDHLHQVRYSLWSFFHFFVDMMTDVIADIMENGPNATKIDQLHTDGLKFQELPEFDRRLIELTMKTAERNSFMLRLAMSRFGSHVITLTAFLRAKLRLMTSKPNRTLHAMKQYADLARTLKKVA